MWRKSSALASAALSSDRQQPPLEQAHSRADQTPQPDGRRHQPQASPRTGGANGQATGSRSNESQGSKGHSSPSSPPVTPGDDTQQGEQDSPVRVIRPPEAESTRAERRGPPWLVTIFDFLERQFSLAASVEDRIRLVRAYTGAALVMSVTFLAAAVAMAAILALASTHRPSLIIFAASAVIAGVGASIRRIRRKP